MAPLRPWTLYRITNTRSGKCWIGLTVRRLERRWAGHLHSARRGDNHPLYNAMRREGFDAFAVEVLACARTRADACEAERALIRQHGSRRPGGYNMSSGGESREGVTSHWKGKTMPPARVEQLREGARLSWEKRRAEGWVSPKRGRPLPEARKKHLSVVNTGKGDRLTPEGRKAISEAAIRRGERQRARKAERKAPDDGQARLDFY